MSAVWVFRFSSAERRLRLRADPVLPEVIVSQVTTYALGETERRIESAVELEIREAPLREVTLHVPAEYALVSVQGEDVADYALEKEAKEGRRALRLVFSQPVDGRRLLRLRLERLQVAASGPWTLPVLRFPSAKSVRGQIGIKTTPGYRMSPGGVRELAELPLSLYSDESDGLQLAFRVRSEDWTAVVNVEAVGQSVQADVFHLYSLREGVVAGSVLFNFFVIGAPASEWRIAVPSGAANIDVQGQGVRREWRREGDEMVVSLHEPALGAVSMLVTFELPMAAGAACFSRVWCDPWVCSRSAVTCRLSVRARFGTTCVAPRAACSDWRRWSCRWSTGSLPRHPRSRLSTTRLVPSWWRSPTMVTPKRKPSTRWWSMPS
jgi:hypothetical protein